jgi:DNA-binding NtrC family response regulator
VLCLETESGVSSYGAARTATVPLSFRPEQLRRQVQRLLIVTLADTVRRRSFLEYPLLPKEVAELAQRAAATQVPVLISGEGGTGKTRLARAIHAAGPQARFISLPAGRMSADGLERIRHLVTGPVTLYVSDVGRLDSEAQEVLLELCEAGGFDSAAGMHEARLICATDRPLEALAGDPTLEPELFYRLSVLPLTLPPLRCRTKDIAELVAVLARDLGESLPNRPYVFTMRAIERMERYMWFGNLAELEAVMLRSMAMAPDSTIDGADLLFDSTRVEPVQRQAVRHAVSQPAPVADKPQAAPSPAQAPAPIPSETVDLVIQELAHEFRNPMVTIKTLTQRLERLLEDKAGRDQVKRMTGEAVDRMDRALENLLQFTRFGDPVAQPVALSPLVTSCLSQLSSTFAERQVLLNYEPPEAERVNVDGAQVGYALENLLRVVLRDLRDGDTLEIHPFNGHGISLEFPARGRLAAEKLAEMADHPPGGDGAAQSLGFFFAKALVERNGGKIEIHPHTGRTVIAVALPAQGDVAAKHGNASNTRSR